MSWKEKLKLDICEEGETSDKMLVPGRGQRGKIEREFMLKNKKTYLLPWRITHLQLSCGKLCTYWELFFYNGTHHFEHSDLGSACNSWSKSKTCSELQTNKKPSVYSNMLGYNHIEKTRAAPWLGISSGSGHTCGLEQHKGIVVLACSHCLYPSARNYWSFNRFWTTRI